MNNKGFVLNGKGVRELLTSDEMKNVLRQYANQVESISGSGYTASSYVGKNRANASVVAETKSAKKDNLQNNTLLKALGSIKG